MFDHLFEKIMCRYENIESIYLFGSYARGDADSFSDIDIFILIEDCSEQEYVEFKKRFSEMLEVPTEWLSLYKIKTIKDMGEKGSYFLWHLKKEGIMIFSRNKLIENILKNLPMYSGAQIDLSDYLIICTDIRNSISIDTTTFQFELSVLATLVRNTCIALAYLNRRYDFGRTTPILTCQEIYKEKFPFKLEEYEQLYKFRIYYTRGEESNLTLINPTKEIIFEWVKHVETLVGFGLKLIQELESNKGCE